MTCHLLKRHPNPNVTFHTHSDAWPFNDPHGLPRTTARHARNCRKGNVIRTPSEQLLEEDRERQEGHLADGGR